MKFSVNWLREFVDLPKNAEEIAELLTRAGVETENIETRGAKIDKVIVSQVTASSRHPNADRLTVCEVEDGGVHYAATAHLDPLLATLERLGFHIDFQARFGERKMVRTKLDLGFCTKQLAHKKFERAFQIGDADILVDIKSFDLVELRAVGRVYFLVPIGRARRDHANWRRH